MTVALTYTGRCKCGGGELKLASDKVLLAEDSLSARESTEKTIFFEQQTPTILCLDRELDMYDPHDKVSGSRYGCGFNVDPGCFLCCVLQRSKYVGKGFCGNACQRSITLRRPPMVTERPTR